MPKDQGFFPQRRDGQNIEPYANREVSMRGPGARTSPNRKAEMARPELLDVGPIGQAYEQWSKGDLMNRAQQLGIQGPLTHEQMIERIREVESRPKRKAPTRRKTPAAKSARGSSTKSRKTTGTTARAAGARRTAAGKAKTSTTKRPKAATAKTAKATPTKRAPAKAAATATRKKATATANTRKRTAASPKARGTRASAGSTR